MPATPPNTLGLDDDWDTVDLQNAVERAFDVKLTQDEAVRILTVGDLYEAILAKLAPGGGAKCASMMAFLRLRRALADLQPGMRLCPTTPLRDISGLAPKAVWKHLARKTSLAMPSLNTLGIVGAVGALVTLVSIVSLFVFTVLHVSLLWSLILFAASFAMIRIDRGAYGRGETLGDLAERCAACNYAELARLGARSSPSAAWDALTRLAFAFTEVDGLRREDIVPETVILESQFRRAIRAA